MSRPEIITGDNSLITVRLLINGSAVSIDSADAVKSALVSLNHKTRYTDVVDQASDEEGANWGSGIVAILTSGLSTVDITYQGNAYLEIQHTPDGGSADYTWFLPVTITKGQVE